MNPIQEKTLLLLNDQLKTNNTKNLPLRYGESILQLLVSTVLFHRNSLNIQYYLFESNHAYNHLLI